MEKENQNKIPKDKVAQEPKTEEVKEVIQEPTQTVPAAKITDKFVNQDKDEYNLEVIEDWDGKVDIFTLEKKDPNYKYRFLKADPTNLAKKTSNLLLQGGGWQICPRQHLIKLGLGKKLAPDGTYRAGDQVLTRIPVHLWEKKMEYKKKMAGEPIKQVNREQKDGDDSVAGLGHDKMKGIQTKESLRM